MKNYNELKKAIKNEAEFIANLEKDLAEMPHRILKITNEYTASVWGIKSNENTIRNT
tara:strand:- start:451 stop:621 length:171 start_codon:yes stop_codon:yes gene_type:complete